MMSLMKQDMDDKTTNTINELQNQLDQMQIKNKQLQKHLNESIGFSAKLSGDKYIVSGEIVSFDDVISNFGGHYSTDTYTFTCPANGVYSFSMSTNKSSGWAIRGILFRNSDELIRAHASDDMYRDSASATVVTECSAGDQVFVSVDEDTGYFDGTESPWYFSGYLLHHL